MSDEVLQGPFPEITDFQAELVMPVGRPRQRAVYLRLDLLDADERSATVGLSIGLRDARRLAAEILAVLD